MATTDLLKWMREEEEARLAEDAADNVQRGDD